LLADAVSEIVLLFPPFRRPHGAFGTRATMCHVYDASQ